MLGLRQLNSGSKAQKCYPQAIKVLEGAILLQSMFCLCFNALIAVAGAGFHRQEAEKCLIRAILGIHYLDAWKSWKTDRKPWFCCLKFTTQGLSSSTDGICTMEKSVTIVDCTTLATVRTLKFGRLGHILQVTRMRQSAQLVTAPAFSFFWFLVA